MLARSHISLWQSKPSANRSKSRLLLAANLLRRLEVHPVAAIYAVANSTNSEAVYIMR